MKLEYQQLAESVVSIKGVTPANKILLNELTEQGEGHQNLQKKIYAEYELTFDEAIRVAPTIIDLSSVKLLDKYRRDALFTSLYDATLASTLQFSKTLIKSAHGISGKRPLASAPIKQITGLFDEDILGREINTKEFGICHHCKQLKPIAQLYKCNYRSARTELQPRNLPAGVACKGKKHGQRSLPHGRHKKCKKTNEYYCCRMFCQICITLNYDILLEAAKSPTWICPYCLVIS